MECGPREKGVPGGIIVGRRYRGYNVASGFAAPF